MFALVCSDAKKISALTTLRQKSVEALVNINNSFRTFPHVVNSSFHIFPRSSSLGLGSEWSCQEACPSPDSGPALPKCSFRCGNEWGAGDSASLARLILRLSQRKTCSPGPFLASRATPASDAFSDSSLYLPGPHRLPHSTTPALSSVCFTESADPSLTWRHGQPCSVPPCLSPSPLRARASGVCALGLSVCVLCQNRRQQAFPTKGQRVNILGFPLQIDRDRLGRWIDGWMNG